MVMLTNCMQIFVICKLLFHLDYLIVIVVHSMVIKIGVLIVYALIMCLLLGTIFLYKIRYGKCN